MIQWDTQTCTEMLPRWKKKIDWLKVLRLFCCFFFFSCGTWEFIVSVYDQAEQSATLAVWTNSLRDQKRREGLQAWRKPTLGAVFIFFFLQVVDDARLSDCSWFLVGILHHMRLFFCVTGCTCKREPHLLQLSHKPRSPFETRRPPDTLIALWILIWAKCQTIQDFSYLCTKREKVSANSSVRLFFPDKS